MNITQTFYDSLASHYDKLFLDWQATAKEQALILDRIFRGNGFDTTRNEISALLLRHGCSKVSWLFPEETGFYQPIVVAKK